MLKFRKAEIRRYDSAINHIRESLKEDSHDFWSALFCSGITFSDEVSRFKDYAELKKSTDILRYLNKGFANVT